MSFFRQEFADSFRNEDQCLVEDTEVGVEIADGVVIERRSVLMLSAAAVATLLFGTSALRGQDAPAAGQRGQRGQQRTPGKLTFAQFLAEVYPLARRVVAAEGQDEEAYLMTVAAAMSRLSDPAAPMREAMQAFRDKHKDDGERFPLAAMTLNLKPGRGFSPHDHLDYNGVIMGIEGEVRIRNFDFQGKPPAVDSSTTFQIRETRDDLILPGRMSSLGRSRENIHELMAGKDGARVLDVFTFFQRGATSRYLDVEAKPRDAEARIYDAAWKPPRRRR